MAPSLADAIERGSVAIRRHPRLARAEWLWGGLRPHYNRLLAVLGRRGLMRTINGTDPILVLPRARGIPEIYEPDTWAQIMTAVRPGDVVVDVGAFLGLYTIALAKRVGPTGRVVSFEPDPENFAILRRHVELNDLGDRVELHQVVVSDSNGTLSFEARGNCESRISEAASEGRLAVRCVNLDTILSGQRADLLKIDVEGHEEHVLRGASMLLSDADRAPRAILLEVHPYAWNSLGVSSTSLLRLLSEAGYRVVDIHGSQVQHIGQYGEVIAVRAALPEIPGRDHVNV